MSDRRNFIKKAALGTIGMSSVLSFGAVNNNTTETLTISDKKKGYFFDVSLENVSYNFNYQTRWSPNTEILLLIAEYYKVDFIYHYEEIGNQIYGVTVYSNNELKEICLEEEDFEQYDYHEETDTYTFEEEKYKSDYEILEILLKRKIENYENHRY